MVSPGTPAISSPSPVGAARSRNSWLLVDVLDGELRARFLAQVGRLGAIFIVIGFSVAMPFASRAAAGDASGAQYVRALYWLSWFSAGWICFSAAGRRDEVETASFAALALQRGHRASSFSFYQGLAVARRIARVVGVSTLVLGVVLIGSSRSLKALAIHAALAVAGVGYALLLASVLALVVQIARRASPAHPRTLFAALIFGPHVARALFPGAPSVPALFGWLLGFMRQMGGVIA